MLHVLNGDEATLLLDAAGVDGARVVWREALSELPASRAQALDLGWMESAAKEDEIVLWFDTDLFCEVDLAFLAHALPEGLRLSRAAGTHDAREPDAVRRIHAARAPFAREAYRRAWTAYAGHDPRALLDVELPWVRYHLARFPGARDGLGELERRILRAVDEGAPVELHALHRAVSRADGYGRAMGLTDRSVEGALAMLSREPRPLLSRAGLTDDGRAVLAGREDAVRLRGVDRWLGGVHLRGRGPTWRWDGSTLRYA